MAVFPLLVIIHEHEGRNSKKIEEVDTDRKTHEEGDEHDPSVRIRLVRLLIPFRHGPEYKGRDQ